MRLLLTALILLPACAAGAATPPKAIEDEARQAIYDRVTDGASPEEIKETPAWMLKTAPKMFSKVDINGDKLADWRVNFEHAPNASYFCGTGGCRNLLYVGQPNGSVRKVFEKNGGDYVFSGPKSARRLDVNLHGSNCGSFGADECLRAWRWDEAAGRYVETPNSKGQTLLPNGSIPALYPALKDAPGAVQAEVAARQTACKAAGARESNEDIALSDLPDVNGDGVRDWVGGMAYTDCNYDSETPANDPGARLTFLVSDGAAFVKAFDQKDVAWNLDVGAAPARITIILPSDDCGLAGKPCPTRTLAWDAATKTLK